MTSPTKRRPLPALVFLLALSLLAALVWWRVLHRDDGQAAPKAACPTTQAPKALPQPEAISVTVLNSTKRNGIARIARAALIKDGFLSPAAAANDQTTKVAIPGVAEIRYGPTAVDAGKLLAYYLPGATLVATASTDSTVVVSLGTKYTAVAAPAAVSRALKTAGITLKRTTGVTASSSPSC
ncbi:MAG: LytR C-terminal domain-containing protein [Jatrophihabitantaceae bacterium]